MKIKSIILATCFASAAAFSSSVYALNGLTFNKASNIPDTVVVYCNGIHGTDLTGPTTFVPWIIIASKLGTSGTCTFSVNGNEIAKDTYKASMAGTGSIDTPTMEDSNYIGTVTPAGDNYTISLSHK